MWRELRYFYEEVVWDELLPIERRALEAAQKVAQQAYAPYSHFPVGAAVVLEDGRIFTGNNQENAAYPSGLCAERVVLFQVGAAGLSPQIRILAIYAPRLEMPVMPCGACRQVMHEYQQHSRFPWTILTAGRGDTVYRFVGTEGLLPLAFAWKPASPPT
ncbi:MAG: cytidine deaminase [Bacteroidia bacterium]|nr:cytidine deaminase [Bacteroidia bacterium]MDW8235522.1 cytidine deaminase [Bacteroidia bacterium]